MSIFSIMVPNLSSSIIPSGGGNPHMYLLHIENKHDELELILPQSLVYV